MGFIRSMPVQPSLKSHRQLKFYAFVAVLLIVAWVARSASASEPQASGPITLLTWNIQVGSEHGPFKNGWNHRKHALIPAIRAANPDVFCTQEAKLAQLQFIETSVPGFNRIGVGRDDGKLAGEFCAILYKKSRLKVLKSGTFWLSDTPDTPDTTWDTPYKRICTHALFKDKINGTEFAVISTHFPLNQVARAKAAKLLAKRVHSMYESYPTLLCGDFNCGPNSEPWNEFAKMFLETVDSTHAPTFHLNGVPAGCLDAIFKDEDIHVAEFKVLNSKYNNIYPSDHFGLLAKAFIPEVNR